MMATRADVDALRANLDIVDWFATDHAPHTLFEKESASPPPGYPGLETALAFIWSWCEKDCSRSTMWSQMPREPAPPFELACTRGDMD